jgi:hypothetical protein
MPDAGDSGGGDEPDADVDGSVDEEPIVPDCTVDSDCGDVRVYDCVEEVCATRRLPQGVWISGGGGLTVSNAYEMRISIGAPAPLGKMVSSNYEITVGAGAGRR